MFIAAGIIVWCLFYGGYFLKMLMQKKKGIATDRMGKGQKEKRTFVIEVILKTITYLLAAAQLFSIILDTFVYANSVVRFAGIGIALAGTTVFIVAMATMKSSWRAGVDESQKTSMVTTGIYRLSRNPAFLGFDLLYIGLAIAFANIVLVIITFIGVVVLHLQILEEEKFLPKVFGNEYMAYKKKTGRYFWIF